MFIKCLFLLIFFAVMIGVGVYCRKKATDVGGFVLGGRNVGPWLTAFAYGTSYFSAVIFIGYAGQFGYKFGVASTWIGIGNALIGSLLAWVVLGRRTRVMTQYFQSATMPEFFSKRYESKALRIFSSAIIFVFMIPYTASLYNGLSRLFEMAFGIDYVVCIIVMSVLTGIYVIIGGYMATAVNDFIQGLIMLFGIVAVVVAVLNVNGGFTGSFVALSKIVDANAPSEQLGVFASFFGPDPLGLLGVILLTSLGTWGLPQMVQKFYAIKSEKSIHTGTIISTAFAIIVAGGCYFLGGFGRLFVNGAKGEAVVYDSIVPKMLAGLPDILMAVVVILVLSASMSTLSSLVLTSSSTLTLDFIDTISKNPNSEKKKLSIMRLLVVFFIAIAAVIAVIQEKSAVTFIAQLMGISWGTLAGAFLAPFMYGLYSKRMTKASVWVNFTASVVIMVLNMVCKSIFPQFLQSSINCGVFVMLLGLVLVPVVSLVTPKMDKFSVDKMFKCYEKEVTIPAKYSLSDDKTSVK